MKLSHAAVSLLALSLSLGAASAPAAPAVDEMQVVGVSGDATLLDAKGYGTALKKYQIVRAPDTLRTAADGSVELLMHNGSVIKVGERSQVQVAQLAANEAGGWTADLKIGFGKLRAVVNRLVAGKDRFTVEAPTSVAGIQGTDVIWIVQEKGKQRSTLFVLKGEVEFQDIKKNKIVVKANQTVSGCTSGLLEVSNLSPFVLDTVASMLPIDTPMDESK